MKHYLFFIAAFVFPGVFSCAQKPGISISDRVLHEIDDRLFGQFLEKCSWGGEIGGDLVIHPQTGKPDTAILTKLKAMNIPVIRYPGGTDVDYFSWTDLIDHAPGQTERQPYRTWKDPDKNEIVSDNRLGLNEFLMICEELQAEPIYVLNIGDAFYRKITILEAKENAAAVYAYCNMEEVSEGPDWPGYRRKNGRDKPFNVKYFQIGNETWGFDAFDWKVENHNDEAIRHLFDCIMAVADTLKALDPAVQLIADGPFDQLNALFEEHAKGKIDYLVFHPYLPWGIGEVRRENGEIVSPENMTTEDTWKAWVATPYIDPKSGMAEISPDYHAAQNALNSSFEVAATEWNWNGWYTGSPGKADLVEPDLAKGLGAAGFLHALMRHGDKIKMACQSMLVGKSWGITAIRVDPDYKQEPVYFPSGQATGLYSTYYGDRMLEIEYDNIPTYEQPLIMNDIKNYPAVAELDILATRSVNQLFVHVINRSFDQQHTLKIKLEDGLEVADSYKRHTLSGDKSGEIKNKNLEAISEITGTQFMSSVGELNLEVPAASVSVFVFNIK